MPDSSALVRTYAAWSRVRRDDAFAYARRVLVNHLTDRWRRRLREYPTDDLPEPPGGPDPADEVATRHWLTAVLATLTVRERAVVVMRYLFDLPEAAVARDLGISVGTVKSTSSLRRGDRHRPPHATRTRSWRAPRGPGRDRARPVPAPRLGPLAAALRHALAHARAHVRARRRFADDSAEQQHHSRLGSRRGPDRLSRPAAGRPPEDGPTASPVQHVDEPAAQPPRSVDLSP